MNDAMTWKCRIEIASPFCIVLAWRTDGKTHMGFKAGPYALGKEHRRTRGLQSRHDYSRSQAPQRSLFPKNFSSRKARLLTARAGQRRTDMIQLPPGWDVAIRRLLFLREIRRGLLRLTGYRPGVVSSSSNQNP